MHYKTSNVQQLHEDFCSGPYHVFGDHRKSNSQFCTHVSVMVSSLSQQTMNVDPLMSTPTSSDVPQIKLCWAARRHRQHCRRQWKNQLYRWMRYTAKRNWAQLHNYCLDCSTKYLLVGRLHCDFQMRPVIWLNAIRMSVRYTVERESRRVAAVAFGAKRLWFSHIYKCSKESPFHN